MVDALEIGYAIKERRAELGLTQAQLAQAAGVSKRCLWSLELGQNPGVQLDKLTAVLGALGLDLVISPTGGAEPPAPTAASAPSLDTASTPPLDAAACSMSAKGGPIDALAILTGAPR
ncbi:MAG: helix-turn-helix domain-containing protein [Coriobacteriales bacterium]